MAEMLLINPRKRGTRKANPKRRVVRRKNPVTAMVRPADHLAVAGAVLADPPLVRKV